MISQLNREYNQLKTLQESVGSLCSAVIQSQPTLVTETYANLQQTMRKILVTNKEIPLHLALVIAKTVVFSSLLDEMIESKKRYKKYSSLKKVYDFMTDKVALELKPATNEQVDNINVDLITVLQDLLPQLTGNAETISDIQQTFDGMIKRLSSNTTERNRVLIMKLASQITQSNNDSKKRKQFIDSHL